MNATFYTHPLLVRSIPWVVALWTLLTIYLTTFPSEKIIEIELFRYDKIGHFLIFGGWTFLIGLIQLVYLERIHASLLPIVIIGIAFGGAIEIAQYLLPYGRYASWLDMLANILGCLTAFIALKFIQKQLLNK
jgi:VanZ family protein